MATSAVLVNPGTFLTNPIFSTEWQNPAGHLTIDETYAVDKFDFRGVFDETIGGGDTLDYVTVSLLKDGHYRLVVTDTSTAPGMPQIDVLNADGELQVVNHSSTPKNQFFPAMNIVEFTPDVAGTYYLRIRMDEAVPAQDYRVIGLLDTSDITLSAIGRVNVPNPDELPPPTPPSTENLTAGPDFHTGTDAFETVSGLGGSDTVLGMGGNDSILGGADGDDLNGNIGNDYVAGGDGADFVRGGQNNDTVLGEGGDDWHVNGNMGNDLVSGGDGNDAVFGGAGNDSLRGDAGNDTISGDRDDDVMFGDAGADTFVFGNDSGSDIIKDFGLATGDVVQLLSNLNGSGIASFADVLAHAGNGPDGVVIDLDGGNLLTIEGVTKAQLQADDFLFV